MIAKLTGTVSEISGTKAIIDVQGVGYQVLCTSACESRLVIGQKCELVIHTDVREDAINLYAFDDKLEKQVFLLLTTVKGVGARSACQLISQVPKVKLLKLIADQDISGLTNIKGVGRKTAERILVELKDRVAEFALEGQDSSRIASGGDILKDAIDALKALGFSSLEAERAVKQVKVSGGADVGSVVKEALRFI